MASMCPKRHNCGFLQKSNARAHIDSAQTGLPKSKFLESADRNSVSPPRVVEEEPFSRALIQRTPKRSTPTRSRITPVAANAEKR